MTLKPMIDYGQELAKPEGQANERMQNTTETFHMRRGRK